MIATARVRWIVSVAVLAAVGGIFTWQLFLVQLATAVLIWVTLEWHVFRYRADFLLRQLTVRRHVSDRRGTARVFWLERAIDVTVDMELPGRLGCALAYADVRDLLPLSTRLIDGDCVVRSLLGRGQRATISYRVEPLTVGAVRFHGLRIVLCDLHGFFLAERFISLPAKYRVLPHAVDTGSTKHVRKRHNELPPPGTHLVSRPGVGSELLEIRDYVPGDSPRSIAWKVSARRDTLMSKQYESEVPVRCHLLVDTSPAVRVGYPGPCQANRLLEIAAAVAQTLASSRDPVGLTLFDGQQVTITRPSAHRQTVLRMLNQLAQAMDSPLPPVDVSPDELLAPAFDVARACYPQALQESATMVAGLRFWPRRRHARLRLQLAALLASYFQLDPMTLGELVENDRGLSFYLQSFLTHHHVPVAGPRTDERGTHLFEDSGKIEQVANLVTKAVARGRDNELFVVMAGLLEVEYQLQPLLKAIQVAVARHHRVVVLCGWPPHFKPPPPQQEDAFDAVASLPVDELVGAVHFQQQVAAYHRLRRELGRLRVPVTAAVDSQATRLILSQLELVRGGRVVT